MEGGEKENGEKVRGDTHTDRVRDRERWRGDLVGRGGGGGRWRGERQMEGRVAD